jgi:hypothetical protein
MSEWQSVIICEENEDCICDVCGDEFELDDNVFYQEETGFLVCTETCRDYGRFMNAEDAFEIVMDLAQQNMLNPSKIDRELKNEARKQQLAMSVVHDFLVNNVYD